ncbi:MULTISPECIES: PTS sugar transporter subunit IIA [unclassified Neisseria]|uniref:PTS sugar transporter subunit IIA n=1 Tax=unclassified Neisseria TaxID=2623750 RepID=UPI002665A368|nr:MULTISPECIES: PTS mannose transporter subunit IIA [unclassified Neisseria]MDO1510009.1 PTS mannose transporter subunit IIA [Neisseria sp. MVDL19-042950]MDO1516209.1 PTS mannose transporter subunit IIA [Neisseria sp. MVDL18-041461]MDO1563324.1 PTS mannose transporter subunit IIA [Neisseria sp. MVDL20-010259]
MIGIIIVTHEAIGAAYRGLAQHFFMETPPHIRLLGVEPNDGHDEIIAKIQNLISEIDPEGQGVLVLTDIFGATPCNAARQLVVPEKVAMLTGLNAPMMVKAVQYSASAEDLTAFTKTVKQAAVNGILSITSPPEGEHEAC